MNKRLLFILASEVVKNFNEKHGTEEEAIELMKEVIAQIEHFYPTFSQSLCKELGNSHEK